MSSSFDFEAVKGNLAAINTSYASFGENTNYGNESISTFINNGLASAVNSSSVGAWFSSTWAANTTYAAEFQKNFNEWSQAVTNIMVKNGHTDEEAKELYLPKLMYGNKYFFNKSAYSGNNAQMMTSAERAYRSYLLNPGDTSSLVKFLTNGGPDASQYLFDRAKKAISKKLTEAEEEFMIYNKGKKKLQKGEFPQLSLNGLTPVERKIAEYYNQNGSMPTVDQLDTFTIDGLKNLNNKNKGKEELI